MLSPDCQWQTVGGIIIFARMLYSCKEIAGITGGAFRGVDAKVSAVRTDSRSMTDVDGAMFVAIKGLNHDGHAYLDDLYERGVRCFMVEATVDAARYPEAGIVSVQSSIQALQALASHHRDSFKGIMVAITGSNGKTVTKEWIAQVCPPGVKMSRSPRSYNSQLGVALSLLMLDGDEDIAVIEAGISQRGEMARLQKMIRPDVGIFTNIGDAHQENFNSLDEKLNEKLDLFKDSRTIIYNASEGVLVDRVRTRYADRMLVGVDEASYPLPDNLKDQASKEDGAYVVALYDVLGYDTAAVLKALAGVQPVTMRLEIKDGINDCKIINDSYNSDINSLEIALDYLGSMAGNRRKVLIMSDIYQSGMFRGALYAKVGRLVASKGVELLIGIGNDISEYAGMFSCEKMFFDSTESFLADFNRSQLSRCCVLLKGSRRFAFERICRQLESKRHTTILEVNLEAMSHNLSYFRSLIAPGVKVMAMVKALGYGTGGGEIAEMLQTQGVDFLAVAFADEGVALREYGITIPVVVLNADSDSFDMMVEYNLEPEIYSFASFTAFVEAVQRHGERRCPIHVKLDTGMHRLGFEAAQIDELIGALRNSHSVYVRSVFSHLAASDEACHDAFTTSQVEAFASMSGKIIDAFPQYKILRHIANSAGIERRPDAHFEMVRLGIGLYGVGVEHADKLMPVSTLRSRIVQIKTIPANDTIGYGRKGHTDREVKIATVPVGYADGFNRRLSNGGWEMIVGGEKAPIIGNICMDTCMIDITGIDVSEGDEVIIFGPGADVSMMAERLGTIPYEIMTSVSTRVKRIYVR